MAFFKDDFDIEPTPVGCVETLPDTDANGVEIESFERRARADAKTCSSLSK